MENGNDTVRKFHIPKLERSYLSFWPKIGTATRQSWKFVHHFNSQSSILSLFPTFYWQQKKKKKKCIKSEQSSPHFQEPVKPVHRLHQSPPPPAPEKENHNISHQIHNKRTFFNTPLLQQETISSRKTKNLHFKPQ